MTMACNDLCFQALTLNVRGLVNHQKRLTLFKWLQDKNIDIAALQETHCTPDFIKEFNSDWNGQVWHSAAPSKYSSGTCILFASHFDAKVINHITDKDGRKVLLNVNINDEDMTITSIYAPNNLRHRKDFLKNLIMWTNENAVNPNNLIVLGDFNIVLNKTDRFSNHTDSSTTDFIELTKQLNMKDAWSHTNNQSPKFTWEHLGDHSRKSRIDYILVSKSITQEVKSCKILNALISDHKAVLIRLDKTQLPRGAGYWKLNTSHLDDTKYVSSVKNIIKETIKKYDLIEDKRLVWDMVKILVREYSIEYSVQKANAQRSETVTLEKQINILDIALEKYCCKEFERKRDELKTELSRRLLEKSKGAQIRARAKYIEEGERSTSYFFNLEKHHQKQSVVTKLASGNTEYTDNTAILHHMTSFYKSLYKSKSLNTTDLNKYLHSTQYDHLLSDDDKLFCDKE